MRNRPLGRKQAPVSKRTQEGLERKPWKLLLWTAVAGLIFGLIGFGEIAEDWLRVARNSFHQHSASGQVVIVKIDDPALRAYGNWPWPRRYHGQLIDRLTAAGAKAIFFDINFSYPANSSNDQSFADAIKRSNRVTLGARARLGQSGMTRISGPLPQFTKFARLAAISAVYNYQNAVWFLPYALTYQGRKIPSLAAAIAGRDGAAGSQFRIDYSTDIRTIPAYSAGSVLSGKVPVEALRGKDVLVGIDSEVIGDRYFVPGYGRTGGTYINALGAETLRNGQPLDVGWIPAFVVGLAAVVAAMLRKRFAERIAIFAAGFSLL